MQNQINQSSNFNDASHILGASPGIQVAPASQNISPQVAHHLNNLQDHNKNDESLRVEPFFIGAPSQKQPSDLPSRIGSRAGSNMISHSIIQAPQMSQPAALETTQPQITQNLNRPGHRIQNTNSISTFTRQYQQALDSANKSQAA